MNSGSSSNNNNIAEILSLLSGTANARREHGLRPPSADELALEVLKAQAILQGNQLQLPVLSLPPAPSTNLSALDQVILNRLLNPTPPAAAQLPQPTQTVDALLLNLLQSATSSNTVITPPPSISNSSPSPSAAAPPPLPKKKTPALKVSDAVKRASQQSNTASGSYKKPRLAKVPPKKRFHNNGPGCFPLPSVSDRKKKDTIQLKLTSFQAKWRAIHAKVKRAKGAFPTQPQRQHFAKELFLRQLGKTL